MKYKIQIMISLSALSFFLSMQMLTGQSGSSSSPRFFDAKYKILKNSIMHGTGGSYTIRKSSPARIVRLNGDSIFFELKPTKPVLSGDTVLLKQMQEDNKIYYFLISEGEDKLRFSDFDFSPLVIPMKIRPALDNQPVQFTGDVSAGPYFGYQMGSKSYDGPGEVTQTALTLCAFGSPTMVNLHPANQSDNADGSGSVLGISAGTGILFDIDNLQFGLTCGWDWISGTASETWIYQGRVWTSFSFAYNLSNQ